MPQAFLITFREGLLWSFLLFLISSPERVKDKAGWSLLPGALAGLAAGFSAGYFPQIGRYLPGNSTWTFWRFVTESVIFYFSIFSLFLRARSFRYPVSPGLALLGFAVCFFEARAAAFVIHDIGLMQGVPGRAAASGGLGLLCGLVLFPVLRKYGKKIPLHEALTFPIVFLFIGAFKFVSNGVGELEKGNILSTLQKGISGFLAGAVNQIQSALLLTGHPFLKTPLSDLFGFLSGERIVMSLALLFLMAPPLFLMLTLFARPDPELNDTSVAAQKRLKVAFFRRDIMLKTIPVLVSFLMLIVMVHAANVSMNPLYDPVPVPVRESDGEKIVLPLADRLGDLSDGKMRKYVYYYGNKEIVFLAVLKPDGSVGVALDQCEICRPADWNKAAQGYAQRGSTLVCKYCMTPIALPTVNNPGGCNPIPLSFTAADGQIVIPLREFLDTYKKAEALEKKGTHL